MRIASEYLQMLCDSGLHLGVTRQGAATDDAETIGCFLFRQPVITHAMVDDDAGGFLRDELSCPVGIVVLLSAQSKPP